MTKSFTEVISGIRTAKKGVEVREDLAQMGEYCQQFTQQAGQRADAARDAAKGYADNAKASEEKATQTVQGIDQTKADAVSAVNQAKETALKEVASSTTAASTAAQSANASKDAAEKSASAEAASESTASSQATNAAGSASAAANSATKANADATRAEKAAGNAAAIVSTDKTLTVPGAPADSAAVGEALGQKLSLSGGTMTGPLIMPGGGSALSIEDNAATHNMVYRGKALGASVTSEQWAAIKAGTFKDLYLGDYWSIGGVDYLIAAFNYWINCGDTTCNTNHLLVVPRSNMYTAKMNDTNITTGGYVGSDMYKNGLTQAKTTINSAFGSAHILNHRQYLVNAVTNGAPTGTDWYDSTVELMNENMVYGGRQFSPMPNGATDPWNTCRNYTIDKSQLPLFHLAPWLICSRQWYWLRDVVSAAHFAGVHSNGTADCGDAIYAAGVRPVAGIC